MLNMSFFAFAIINLKIHISRGPARSRTMAYFGEGKGPIHVDNVKCTGNERSLADCIKQDIGRHNCRHSEDAGVICDYLNKKASGNSNKGGYKVKCAYFFRKK